MDVFKAIKNRRSIRAFTEDQVSDSEVEKLIEAARFAPSAGNIQPWEFIVVLDQETKKGLREAALDQAFIEEAPVVIVVCANVWRSGQGYGSRGINLYSLQDTAAATENMLLAATALGLATCWVGAFREEQVKDMLKIPDGVRPIAIVPIGHAAEKPTPRSRRPSASIIHHDTYGRK